MMVGYQASYSDFFFRSFFQSKRPTQYSKHTHIRTLFAGLRLIVFLLEGCLARNPPESVLKMFLTLVSEILQTIYF